MSNLPQDDRFDDSSPLRDGRDREELSVAEELHRRYHRLVYYIFRIFKLPHEHHEDIFNQIFLKIVSGLSKLKHSDNLKSWVVTITKNEIRGYMNKRNREMSLYRIPSPSANSSLQEVKHASEEPSPEKNIYISQLRDTFEEIIEQLDESISLPFLMRYRDHMRWRQIAETLDLNEDTARKRSNKARDLIRLHFKRKFGPYSPMF